MRATRVVVMGLVIAAVPAAGCSADRGASTVRHPPSQSPPASAVPSAAADPRCAPAHAQSSGTTVGRFITPAGRGRRYFLYVPPGYDGRRPVPLVVNLHGHGSSAELQQLYSGLTPVADEMGFVLVAMEGQGRPLHYNLRREARRGEESDVAVAARLVDELAGRLCLDADRVYAAGMSNGGALAASIACYEGDRFAAVGAVAALAYDASCDDSPPVPIIVFRGTDDPIVPYAGGVVRCCGSPTVHATEEDVASWARHNGCEPRPRTGRSGAVRTMRYQGCTADADVVLHAVEGDGHTWPGGVSLPGLGHTTREINAATELWRFFAAHPRR